MSFLTTSMRVAVQNRHRKPAGYHFRVGTRAGGRDDRNTLCGPAFPLIENLPAILPSAAPSLTVVGSGKLADRPDEADPLVSLVCRRFLNLLRRFEAAGCLLPFRSLLEHLQQRSCALYLESGNPANHGQVR